EVAFHKPATDIVLIGHAHAPGDGATQVDVGIKVGPVQKVARVFGARYWLMTNGTVRMSRTAALTAVSLSWENAFGGVDDRASTPDHAVLEPRNPVGTGFGKPLKKDGDHLRLPNIEDPDQLITGYGAVVTPSG